MNRSLLGTAGTQCCWGPSEKLYRKHLRIVPRQHLSMTPTSSSLKVTVAGGDLSLWQVGT